MLHFRGELAALSAALIWAIASVVYSGMGRHLPPLLLNLAKGLIAVVLLLVTLLVRGDLLPEVPLTAIGLLLASGAIGIGFGDTAYFAALNCLGARRALVLESLAPPLAALLALVFLQEQLRLQAWVGIALTIAGVAWVVIERAPIAAQVQHPLQGVGFGVLAAFGQAGGAVLSRAALAGTEINPLWSTLVRLVAGILVLLIWLIVQQTILQKAATPLDLQPLRLLRSSPKEQSRRFLTVLVGTAFASTYLAIWLQQISLKYTATGIAQSLSATSPLFVIPIALWRGEPVSVRSILGVLLALGGIWLLFTRG